MTADGLIRRLRKVARARGVPLEVQTRRGKGSHAVVYFGIRRTIVPLHKGKDLPKNTLRSILRALAVEADEL